MAQVDNIAKIVVTDNGDGSMGLDITCEDGSHLYEEGDMGCDTTWSRVEGVLVETDREIL